MNGRGFCGTVWSSLTERLEQTDWVSFCLITGVITDVALSNMIAKINRKYRLQYVELKDMYKLQEAGVEIVPVVISANGLVTKEWRDVRQKLQENEQSSFIGDCEQGLKIFKP